MDPLDYTELSAALDYITTVLYPCSLLLSRSAVANHKAMQTLKKNRTNCRTNIVIASQKLLIFVALVAAAQYVCHHVTLSQGRGDLYSPAHKNFHLLSVLAYYESHDKQIACQQATLFTGLKQRLLYCIVSLYSKH